LDFRRTSIAGLDTYARSSSIVGVDDYWHLEQSRRSVAILPVVARSGVEWRGGDRSAAAALLFKKFLKVASSGERKVTRSTLRISAQQALAPSCSKPG
jgi:hypothetical protein